MNKRTSITKLLFLAQGKILKFFLILGAMFAFIAPVLVDANVSGKTSFIQQTSVQKQELSEKWGVELVAMRSTASGHMIDFRYRVLDAEKAAPLFKRQTKPYLIHQGSGKALAVPNTAKLGSLRNSNTPQKGRTYWMFFGNNQGLIRKGDKVTVAIGDFRVKDIEVK